MSGNGYINPEREAFGAFQAMERAGPVHMLNLIRLRDVAEYPDGTKVSGREAYATYGRESAPIFQRVGGKIVWRADPELMLIGPQEEKWDIAFIAEYPSPAAFVEMVKDADYQKIVIHRTVAVLDSRLVRTQPQEMGQTFG